MSLVSFNATQLQSPPISMFKEDNTLRTLKRLGLKDMSGRPVDVTAESKVKPIFIKVQDEAGLQEGSTQLVFFVEDRLAVHDRIRDDIGEGALRRLAFLAKQISESPDSLTRLGSDTPLDERSNLPWLV